MRAVAWLAGVATLLVGFVYTVLSLNRWEWNRALFFGLIVLVAEVGLATALVLRKLGELADRPEIDPRVLQALEEHRPPRPNRFAWLDPADGRTNVFITFLVGGGVAVSAVAWLVDQIASRTGSAARERQLAEQLGRISYPADGLVADDVTALAQTVPGGRDDQLATLLRRSRRRGERR